MRRTHTASADCDHCMRWHTAWSYRGKADAQTLAYEMVRQCGRFRHGTNRLKYKPNINTRQEKSF